MRVWLLAATALGLVPPRQRRSHRPHTRRRAADQQRFPFAGPFPFGRPTNATNAPPPAAASASTNGQSAQFPFASPFPLVDRTRQKASPVQFPFGRPANNDSRVDTVLKALPAAPPSFYLLYGLEEPRARTRAGTPVSRRAARAERTRSSSPGACWAARRGARARRSALEALAERGTSTPTPKRRFLRSRTDRLARRRAAVPGGATLCASLSSPRMRTRTRGRAAKSGKGPRRFRKNPWSPGQLSMACATVN